MSLLSVPAFPVQHELRLSTLQQQSAESNSFQKVPAVFPCIISIVYGQFLCSLQRAVLAEVSGA